MDVKRELVCLKKDVIIHKLWKQVNDHGPKTDKIVILALVILVSYKCRSNIDVTYIRSSSW